MKFFIDNNISKKIAKGLAEFGEDVMHLQDQFPEDAPDEEWLEYVGKNGMVLVTRDERIRWNPTELAALKKHKVRAFFMGGKKLDRCAQIRQIVQNWPRMKEHARRLKPPFGFRIPEKGSKFSRINL